MTTACVIFLAISLCCYLISSFLYYGRLFFNKPQMSQWGRAGLILGVSIHTIGIAMHLLMSGLSPFSNMLSVISLLIIFFAGIGIAIEYLARIGHLGLLLAPLAFLALLYPMLMPVQFHEAESMLLRFPWLGVHVFVTLLGDVGFTLSFCTAAIYLFQVWQLKQGQLNRYLPALDIAGKITDYAAGCGFFLFSIGLAMGLVWLFNTPGDFLGHSDAKILLALPTWLCYAAFLYMRGIRGEFGSRLKWLVIVGFLFVVINLLGVRHDFTNSEFL